MSPPLEAWLLSLHVALDLAVGLVVLLLGRVDGRIALVPPSWRRVVAALVATSVCGTITIVLGHLQWDVEMFGAVHLLFGDVLITAPVLGVALLLRVARARSRRWSLAALGLALVAVGACGAWGHWVEPFRLQVETPIVVAGDLDRELRIAILADLQTAAVGAYEERAIDALLATEPDLILIPGDLFQGTNAEFDRELPALRAQLSRLRAPLGVVAVLGNTDRPRRFARAVADTGIRWLHNEQMTIPFGAGEIVIGGLGWSPSDAASDAVRELGAVPPGGRLRLLLLHEPGVLYTADLSAPPDLAIAGHTHGGQVNLPFVGAVLTLSRLPARYAWGLHGVLGTQLYVSRGVGVERSQAPRVRFLCPPEVTLMTVRPAGGA